MPPLAEEEEMTMNVMGCNLSRGGLPQSVTIHSQEIREALKSPLEQIVEAVLKTLSNVPPELAGDICDAGIVLVGGGAMLKGMDRLISKATKGIPVHVAEDPMTAVVRGTGMLIQSIDSLVKQLDNQYAD